MKNNELIIKLLIEDLKFHQMTLALKPLKLSIHYSLDIVSIISSIMLSNKRPSDKWLNVYTEHMNKADEYQFWSNMALTSLAHKCYDQLKNV